MDALTIRMLHLQNLARRGRTMYCKKCKVKMEEQSRSYHKKRKWTCPRCGRSRMQQPHERSGGKHKHERSRPDFHE